MMPANNTYTRWVTIALVTWLSVGFLILSFLVATVGPSPQVVSAASFQVTEGDFARAATQPEQVYPPPRDDEIVLLTAEGRIQVVDPFTPEGYRQVTFMSNRGAWRYLTTGDVNGDGDDEIIATRVDELAVFDPVVPPGTPAATWRQAPPLGEWTQVAAGDVDADGQDEIVATLAFFKEGHLVGRVMVLDPNPTATEFDTVFQQDLEVPVKAVDTGDVDGDGLVDVVILGDIRALFYAFQGGLWDTLFRRFEPNPWLGLAVGQVHGDSARAEMATLRLVSTAEEDTYQLHQWVGGQNTTVLDRMAFTPPMEDVAAVDLNGDGDDELLFIRSDDQVVPLVVRNPAGFALPREIQIWAGPGWKRIAGGDLDGDGLGEIVILKETGYRIFTEPELSDRHQTFLGGFALQLAVGNLDGEGIPEVPILQLSANTVTFIYQAYELPPPQAVLVKNVGAGGAVSWEAEVIEGNDWLHVAPQQGTTPGTLTLSVTPSHLRSGTYEGRVVVRIPGAANSPQEIQVFLTVFTPVLEVQPRAVFFDVQKGNPPVNQVVAIRNLGFGGSIGWEATVVEPQPWLTITPTVGTTPELLTIAIDPRDMAPDVYLVPIRVAAQDPVVANSPITLTVQAIIRPPVLSVTPSSIYLNLWPDETYEPPSVNIEQAGVPGGQAIRWVAGVIPHVSVLPTSLTRQAITRVTPQGVTFGEGADALTVPAVDWVVLDPWYGITPSRMRVRVLNDRMAPGLYRATIVVDGGPGTVNRFQGVDLTVMIPGFQVHLPLISR